MKKFPLALATAGLTVSLGAFAALPTDAQPFQVVVPNLKDGMDITLEGLYLRPSSNDIDYATVSNFTSNVNGSNTITGNVDVKTIDPDYDFGFRVGIGYTFPESGNDVQVAWTHFDQTESGSTNVTGQSTLVTKLGHITNVNNNPTSDQLNNMAAILNKFVIADDFLPTSTLLFNEAEVSSEAKIKIDAIDADVGQFVDIGTRLRVRLFGGLRYAELENDQTTHVFASNSFIFDEGFDADGQYDYQNEYMEDFNSQFVGIGPRFGVDSVYHIGNCFGIVGHASIALLAGKVKDDSSYKDFFTATFIPEDGSRLAPEDAETKDQKAKFLIDDSDDAERVVPAFDLKLGLNYSHVFDNESVLTIEGGYQVSQYIDAIDRLEVSTDDFAFAQTPDEETGAIAVPLSVERKVSSVGFDGPYLKLNWKV